jgi:hypothetical protein
MVAGEEMNKKLHINPFFKAAIINSKKIKL